MKRIILPVIFIVVAIGLYFIFRPQKAVGPVNQNEQVNDIKEKKIYKFPGILPSEEINNQIASINTSKGLVVIELYADRAPKTVSNFIYLANEGFYNNLLIHRIEPGFVVQTGDPNGNGTGGPGYKFADEPVVGEYTLGTVAMANSGPNSNGSQFFICLDDLSVKLSKSYNLFGKVISGMDVVKKMIVGDNINSITINNK